MDVQNYKIICDETALKNFIDSLPDCKPNERYYFALFARKKYCPEIRQAKSDKWQLARRVATKDRLLDKIKQLECPLGTYVNSNLPIPQQALALYINPNPRCLTKATYQNIKNLATIIATQSFTGFDPQSEAMSCVHRCCSRKIWVDFDIDVKDDDIRGKIEGILGDAQCYRLLETRGGYHVMVEPSKVPEDRKNLWHRQLSEISDSVGDQMIPCPGTYCGGFIPRFVN